MKRWKFSEELVCWPLSSHDMKCFAASNFPTVPKTRIIFWCQVPWR
jgi:hypothetical protein